MDETEDGPSEVRPMESDWTRRKMDHLPSRPFRFLQMDFGWTIFRLVQSDSFERTFRRIIFRLVQSNPSECHQINPQYIQVI